MAGWGTCYSASNNIHFNFPPIMNDGRNWASWQPEAVINNRIQAQENIHTNWGYRQYMVKNGLEIMKYNSMESCYDLGLNPHTETNTTPSENVPFMYKNSFEINFRVLPSEYFEINDRESPGVGASFIFEPGKMSIKTTKSGMEYYDSSNLEICISN